MSVIPTIILSRIILSLQYILLFIFAFFFSVVRADIPDCQKKQREVAQILFILNDINSVDISELYSKNKINQPKSIEDIDDPNVMAKLIVIAYYIAYPGDISTIPFDKGFAGCSMQLMSKFKHHKDFVQSMKFIENAIRLDAGFSYDFSEVIWDARDIEDVKNNFASRISQWADGVRRHGTKEQREALKKE